MPHDHVGREAGSGGASEAGPHRERIRPRPRQASIGFRSDSVSDALVPEGFEGEAAEPLAVAPVLFAVHPKLVVDEFVFEDALLDFLGRVAVHPADLLGPGPVPAAQEGDAEADFRVPLVPGVLLHHEEPRAARHAG